MLWIFISGCIALLLSGFFAGISLFLPKLKVNISKKQDKVLGNIIFTLAILGFVLINIGTFMS